MAILPNNGLIRTMETTQSKQEEIIMKAAGLSLAAKLKIGSQYDDVDTLIKSINRILKSKSGPVIENQTG